MVNFVLKNGGFRLLSPRNMKTKTIDLGHDGAAAEVGSVAEQMRPRVKQHPAGRPVWVSLTTHQTILPKLNIYYKI